MKVKVKNIILAFAVMVGMVIASKFMYMNN